MDVTKRHEKIPLSGKIFVITTLILALGILVGGFWFLGHTLKEAIPPLLSPPQRAAPPHFVLPEEKNSYSAILKCAPEERAGYNYAKSKEYPYRYKVTFMQVFHLQNITSNYVKFRMRCDITKGPNKYAETGGTKELVLPPYSGMVFDRVEVFWFANKKEEKYYNYYYLCSCVPEILNQKPARLSKILKIPFAPEGF